MLKISTIMFILLARNCFSQKIPNPQGRPHTFKREVIANQMHHNYLQNMTENFCKDVANKLAMAVAIQNTYAESSGYELGIIAANIMEKYRHMLKIYRYYSNHKNFKNERHNISQIMNGYAVMHGDYNEIASLTVLFYKVLQEHDDKETRKQEEAKILSQKYGMSVSAIRDMQKKGINPADYTDLMVDRRTMQKETKLPAPNGKQLEANKVSRRQFLLGDSSNINTWTPKKKANDTQEEEYKKKLRHKMWAKKWNGFNGDTEGVKIADSIARLGLTNDSTFLLKELKGAI